jgi:Nucleotidyl transferase AbiEii toxin, Type IV TA system
MRDSSVQDLLSPLQRDLIEAFFRRETRFFLTGGAALAGYHLGHRPTEDLDLFTTAEALEDGDRALHDAARELDATVESVRVSPTFLRRMVRRGAESLLVDLVRDEAPQAETGKVRRGAVLLDSAEEILANKLCAVLARAEVRDLVDVLFLERAGLSVEQALPLAMRKDGAVSAGQLAWILSTMRVGDDARVPGGITAAELRAYAASLERRLAALAHPGGGAKG